MICNKHYNMYLELEKPILLINCLLLSSLVNSSEKTGSGVAVRPSIWNKRYTRNVYFKVRIGVFEKCALECQLRPKCEGVNFFRAEGYCKMFEKLSRSILQHCKPGTACVTSRKLDMPEISTCPACEKTKTCDLSTGTCIVKECYNKRHLEHGEIIGNMQLVGSTRKVVCDTYYRPEHNTNKMVCQDTGHWEPAPACVPDIVCDDLPEIQNANMTVTGDMTPGTNVMYECDAGTVVQPMNGSPLELTCQSNATWSVDVTLSCLDGCPDPMNISNSNLLTGSTDFGTVRTYECDPNYITRSGEAVINTTCLDTAVWEYTDDYCLRNCSEPSEIPFGTVTAEATTYKLTRKYECEPGTTLKYNGIAKDWLHHSVTCEDDGNWSDNVVCVLECDLQSDLLDGTSVSIGASSALNVEFEPEQVRLNSNTAWISDPSLTSPWIVFEFTTKKKLFSIKTRGYSGQWVTEFTVEYSKDCSPDSYEFVKDEAQMTKKVFTGNWNDDTIQTNAFPTPLLARCIRVRPTSYFSQPALRVGLFGC